MRFSVVIPTYNRPIRLLRILEALTRLEYDAGQFEVVVVDDGSQEPLDQVIARFGGQIQVRLIRQQNAGPAAARNRGVQKAQGEFIAFIDDDCLPEAGWLSAFEQVLVASPQMLAGGRTHNLLPENPYATASQMIIESVYVHYNADPLDCHFFASNNMAMQRQQFLAIGGFDAKVFPFSSEDRDFCGRWRQAGWKIGWASEAVVFHGPDLKLDSYLRMYFRYGCGAFLYRKCRAQGRYGTENRTSAFYRHLFRNLTRTLPSASTLRTKVTVGSLLLLWQLANITGYLYESAHRRRAAALGYLANSPVPLQPEQGAVSENDLSDILK